MNKLSELNKRLREMTPAERSWITPVHEIWLRCQAVSQDIADTNFDDSFEATLADMHVRELIRDLGRDFEIASKENAQSSAERIQALEDALNYAIAYLENLNIGADTIQLRLRAALDIKSSDNDDTVCAYPIGRTTCGYNRRNHWRADGKPMEHAFTTKAAE